MKSDQSKGVPEEVQFAIERAATVAAELMREKGIALYREMKEAISNSRKQGWRERTALGIAKAKAEGKYKGRPVNPVLHQKILMCIGCGMSVRRTAEVVGCANSTVMKVKKQACGVESNSRSLAAEGVERETISAGLKALGHY